MEMIVKTFDNNDMGQNIYLYYDQKSGEGVLIDCGCSEADKSAIAAFIDKNNITVKGILLTHGHYDHIIAIDALRLLTSAAVYSHEKEKEILENPNLNLSVNMGIKLSVTPENFFADGDVFEAGDTTLKVLHTPGHTPGGVCYFDEKNGILFSGDTLFEESIGRSDFPLGDHQALLGSIMKKLITLPDNTKVYPGHGPSTTIGYEKHNNPFLR